MSHIDQAALRAFLKTRHTALVAGLMLLTASVGFPMFIAWVSNLKIESMIDVASKWVGGEYSDCEAFSGALLLAILSIQTGILFAALGVGALFSYVYREIKFRSLIRALDQLTKRPTTSA